MAGLKPENVRAVALVGHGASGKTTLAEALLAATGSIKIKGSVEKGSTVCDADPLEKELGHSLVTSLVSFETAGVRVHLADTPGYPDFAGQAISALAAVDCTVSVATDDGHQWNVAPGLLRLVQTAGDVQWP